MERMTRRELIMFASRLVKEIEDLKEQSEALTDKIECLLYDNKLQSIHILELTPAETAKMIPQGNIDKLK